MAAAMLFATILVMVFFARNLINDSAEESLDNLVSMGVMNNYLAQIKNNMLDMERLIYQQAVNPDLKQRQKFKDKVSGINDLLEAINLFLSKHIKQHRQHKHSVAEIEYMLKLAGTISGLINELDLAGEDYLENSESLIKRVPGMRVLTEELLPNNNRFIEACDLAIAESNQNITDPQQIKIRNIFQNIRYVWAQQISWVRLFIANRSGVFGEARHSMKVSLENRSLYSNQITEYIKELSAYDRKNLLDVQQSLSYEEMKEIIVEYEEGFKKARAEYLSKNWRIDLEQLHKTLKPMIENIWDNIRIFENTLNDYAKTAVSLSQKAANQSSGFVWGVGAIAFAMILLTYFLFDIILRRPILQVARALDAEAAGQEIDIKFNNKAEETELLTNAFRNMQNQVHQRQTRLESILDNAAEGIVTIDEYGIIETFNSAAQMLFGYTAEEVVGNNVSMLVPEPHRSRHDDYLETYNEQGKESIIDVTREVMAERKNGTVFPMSLKVSEMYLDGKRHFTAVVEDISDRKALIQNLRNLAEHDSLTGLYNRLYFSEELEKVINKKLRGDQNTIALLYIDLDNFKYVNDTMGHLSGDQLLVEVASILKSNTRESDLLARLGGDEFAVILFRPDRIHILEAAERFRNSIEEYMFFCDGKTVNIGCSIGVAKLTGHIQNKDQLLSRADIACTEAKKRGRNIVHVFSEEDESKLSAMSSDIGWAGKIKHSITNDNFVLAGQPIVSINTEQTDYYELLLRLQSEDGDLIMPAGFMPAAERFGLLADIDRWVIKHAFALLSQLKAFEQPARFSINLSGNILEDGQFIDFVKQQIEYYKIKPSVLLFEVTESIAIANLQSASNILKALREFGCTTALDDFGVGYSSFTYLKELPVDFVKIDGSFVRDIGTNQLSLAFVKSMNDIAHAMGKKTIAEFVESQECLNKLKEIGVDYGQGYFLGKPELFEDKLHQEALRIKHSA
jgi:diguanylate cyclase (GGDEF)-like protein/PAS domain S-box-containing protein